MASVVDLAPTPSHKGARNGIESPSPPECVGYTIESQASPSLSTVRGDEGHSASLPSGIWTPPELLPSTRQTSIETSEFWTYSADTLVTLGGARGQDEPFPISKDEQGRDLSAIPGMMPASESTPAFSSPPMAPSLHLCYNYPTPLSGYIRAALDDMHFMTSEINVRSLSPQPCAWSDAASRGQGNWISRNISFAGEDRNTGPPSRMS